MLLLTSFARSFVGVALIRVVVEAFPDLDLTITPPTSTMFEPWSSFSASKETKLWANVTQAQKLFSLPSKKKSFAQMSHFKFRDSNSPHWSVIKLTDKFFWLTILFQQMVKVLKKVSKTEIVNGRWFLHHDIESTISNRD